MKRHVWIASLAAGFALAGWLTVKAVQAAGVAFYDTAVPGYRLEAEDFTSSPKTIEADATAGGAKVVRNSGRFILLNLPFPQTSRPVTVYLRVKAGSPKDQFTLGTYFKLDGKHKTLQTAAAASAGQWRWIHFKAVSAKQVGPLMRIDGVPDKGSGRPAAIDSIVLSTQDNFNEAALERAQPLLPPAPFVRVGPAAPPPHIDGREDYPCWKQTVAIKHFRHFGFLTPAAGGTTARLAYDDTNLYVLMVCQEPLLKTADMRQSEIKARITARDGKVLNDDSCLIFLQPIEKGPVYEFTVNTLGTLLDARLRRDDLWGTRDIKWNSSAKAAVKRGDGFWTLEMAIPLADLGVSQVKTGDRWQAGLVRVAQGRKETSSWNPTTIKGAHAPEALGTLGFGEPPVGVAPAEPLKGLEPGANTLQVELNAAGEKGIELISEIRPPQKAPSIQISDFPGPQSGQVKHSFDVNAAGSAQARWGALEGGSMRPIYISPVIHTAVQASNVTMNLTTPGAYEVVVNDQVANRGPKADSTKVKIPLREGANVIAVRAEAGTAMVSLDAPELERLPKAWRINDAAAPKATSSKLDDRNWSIAKANADGAFGQAGKPIVLRRTVLWNKTRVWPVPTPALYVAGNSTQQVNFKLEGLQGKNLEHWTTWLAVPSGLKVAGVTGYYGDTNSAQPKFACTPAGQASIDGRSVPLYKITADKPVRHIVHPVMSLCQVMLQIANPAQAKNGVSWKIHYWSWADEGTVVEPPQSF
jgi:hypothetical protein